MTKIMESLIFCWIMPEFCHIISHIFRMCRLLFRQQWLLTYGKVFRMLQSCCWQACRVYLLICMRRQILTVRQHFRKSVTSRFRQSVRYQQQYSYCWLSGRSRIMQSHTYWQREVHQGRQNFWPFTYNRQDLNTLILERLRRLVCWCSS